MNESLVTVVRGVIAFLTLLILTRVLGKQQIAQLDFFEYVLGITIGSIASSLTIDLSIKAFPQWVGLVTWIVAVMLFQHVTIRWRAAAKYINGEPTIVIMDGKIMEKSMRSLRYTVADLLAQLRQKDVFDPAQVAYAMVETSGQLSVLLKPGFQPVTRNDLNMAGPAEIVNPELIYNGVIIEPNLQRAGVDRVWLKQQLQGQGVHDEGEVFLATIDAHKQLYIDVFQDRVASFVDIDDEPQKRVK
ncbi:MAG TPA: DUF421 domain-containing protein [Firmicutes bacterium]|jgi:uncharacterized membrane protein YcaP (DUF421 family)|nr:DUF421 domain-containing protein [Bacillota bacterium]